MANVNDNSATTTSHQAGSHTLPMVSNTSPQHHQAPAGPRNMNVVPHAGAAQGNVNPLLVQARRNFGPPPQSAPPLILPSPQKVTSRPMAVAGAFMPGGRVVPGNHLAPRPPLPSPMNQPGRPQGTAPLNGAAMNGHQGYAVHSNLFVRPANHPAASSSAAAAAVLVSHGVAHAGRVESKPQPPGQSPVKMPFARPVYQPRPTSTADGGSRPAMAGDKEQQKSCDSAGRPANGTVDDKRITTTTSTNTSTHVTSSSSTNPQTGTSSSNNHNINNNSGPVKVFRVPPVARGPQPQCVEPTRLPDGRRIKDVVRSHAAAQKQPSPSKGAATGNADQSPRLHDAKADQPNGTKDAQQNGAKRRKIRTTEGVDTSWMDGYTYGTWVDSPKWSLLSNHYERVPRKHPPVRRRQDKSDESESSERHGNHNVINFFRKLLS